MGHSTIEANTCDLDLDQNRKQKTNESRKGFQIETFNAPGILMFRPCLNPLLPSRVSLAMAKLLGIIKSNSLNILTITVCGVCSTLKGDLSKQFLQRKQTKYIMHVFVLGI